MSQKKLCVSLPAMVSVKVRVFASGSNVISIGKGDRDAMGKARRIDVHVFRYDVQFTEKECDRGSVESGIKINAVSTIGIAYGFATLRQPPELNRKMALLK